MLAQPKQGQMTQEQGGQVFFRPVTGLDTGFGKVLPESDAFSKVPAPAESPWAPVRQNARRF